MDCIAIHDRKDSFSDKWICKCREQGLKFKIVNCYSPDILSVLSECNVLLWHFHHNIKADKLVAKNVIYSAEKMGLKVFPSIKTCWSFDDKIAQKYQLESVNAPIVKTNIFFSKEDAVKWIEQQSFPKVFKLRCGAGSSNVCLAKGKKEALKLVSKAFSKNSKFDFLSFSKTDNFLSDNPFVLMSEKMLNVAKNIRSYYRKGKKEDLSSLRENEVGYALFQDFIEGNKFDIRITVIGGKTFGFTRNVRPNDWRASGSGSIDYSLDKIDMECVKTAIDISKKLDTQSIAFDFIKPKDSLPLIIEISYGFNAKAIYDCPGHWDKNLNWIEGHIWPQDIILEEIIKS